MSPHDRSFPQPLGPRRPYVVLPNDFQQRGSCHTRYVRRRRQSQHDGGTQDDLQVLDGVVPQVDNSQRGGPTPHQQEQQHRERRQPETGDGQKQHCEKSGQVIRHGILMQGRQDPNRHADGPRQDYRQYRDLYRDRPPSLDQVRNGVAPPEGDAQLSGGDVLQPVGVLDYQWVAEAQIRLDLGAILRADQFRFVAKHDRNWVAGHHSHRQEDDERNSDQRRDGIQQPAQDVLVHLKPPACTQPTPWRWVGLCPGDAARGERFPTPRASRRRSAGSFSGRAVSDRRRPAPRRQRS